MSEQAPGSGWLSSITKESVFQAGIFGSKFLVVILLIIFAFMNHEISFISKKPSEFLAEAMFVGLGTTIPVMFIGFRRGNSFGPVMSAGFIGFLVFFIFHILMEFSGQNEIKASAKVVAQEKKLFWPVAISVSVLGLVLGFIAINVRKFDMCLSESILESAIFGIFNAAPFIWIEYNRGEKNPVHLILVFIKYFFAFAFGSMILQAGGFWTHVFPLPDNIKAEYATCQGGLKFSKSSEGPLFNRLPRGNKFN